MNYNIRTALNSMYNVYNHTKSFPECIYQYIEDSKIYAIPPIKYSVTVILLCFVLHSIRMFLNKNFIKVI